MRILFFLCLSPIYFIYGCQIASGENIYNHRLLIKAKYTVVKPDVINNSTLISGDNLVLIKEEKLNSAPGTKSVLFNTSGSKLYAMNLEGMSIYEFDQSSRKIVNEFKFVPTKGTGWDYSNNKSVPSFQEKPVEACFTNNDSILWVSLHNAEGIVPIRLNNLHDEPANPSHTLKKILRINKENQSIDTINLPLIKTGKTPKVISATIDNQHLLVSNWHSNSVSIIDINNKVFPYAKVVKQIPVSAIPRGIAVNNKLNESYIAIMGGSSIHVISNDQWKDKKDIKVASNPRHIIADSSGRLFVSFNKISRIACIDPVSGNTLFSAPTDAQPRTIKLSKNNQFLFVTCYSGNMVDVFKIRERSFVKIASLPCSGKPVGVDLYEDDQKLEAWVCSYTNGKINVFTFNKI